MQKNNMGLPPFEEIWICSGMHNFTLFNKKTREYSDFHGWRHVSERFLQNEIESYEF